MEPVQNGDTGRYRRGLRRRGRDFTYISSCVKYTIFFCNLLFWTLGGLLAAVGVYASLDKWASGETFKLDNVFDVLFNLSLLLVIVGGVIFFMSMAGLVGALRENLFLLKFYSLCLLLLFLAEMVVAALGLAYPHKAAALVEDFLSVELIRKYRDDLDLQNIVDLVQQEFECCGISSDGFRDWSKNEYFNCTDPDENPSVERCGVPFSCCIPHSTRVTKELENIMCGFGVQAMDKAEQEAKIYTEGCIKSIKVFVEKNLYVVAGVAIGVALTQLFVIWLAWKLEGQIMNQRSLW